MQIRDWSDWHRRYDDPHSDISRRLVITQRFLGETLRDRGDRPTRLLSICAGQGLNVLPVLAQHPGRDFVTATLIELDPRNVAVAAQSARAAGLSQVRVICGDASQTDSYVDAVPADIILACGVFGNISEGAIKFTIEHLPQLCSPGAVVIWTLGRRPGRAPLQQVGQWWATAGFQQMAIDAPADTAYSVVVHRLIRKPQPLRRGVTLFKFIR
jgi:hypothetical protein